MWKMFGFKRRVAQQSAPEQDRRCSFCNKSQRFVKKLVAGPNVHICDECVDICLDILNQTKEQVTAIAESPHAITSCTLCQMPTANGALYVRARGFLCSACVDEIEASLAERRPDA